MFKKFILFCIITVFSVSLANCVPKAKEKDINLSQGEQVMKIDCPADNLCITVLDTEQSMLLNKPVYKVYFYKAPYNGGSYTIYPN